MQPSRNISAIVAARAVACLLVLYCHVVGRPLVIYNETWAPHAFVSRFVSEPLGIIQNFGLFGVALFFFISGFIITHTGLQETQFSFLIKRVARIYPPLFVAVAATMLLAEYCKSIGWSDQALGTAENTSFWFSIVALEFVVKADALIGVLWTVTIEIFFYALTLLLLPVMQRWPAAFVVLTALIPVAVATAFKAIAIAGGPSQFGIAGTLVAYIPAFAIGSATYFAWSGRMSVRLAAGLGTMAWVAFIWSLRIANSKVLAESYPAQFGMALAVFLAFLWLYRERKAGRVLSFYADISYSLYLIHLPFAVFTAMVVYPRVGLTAAIIASSIVTTLLAWAMHRWIELPAHGIARAITARRMARALA